MRAADEVVAELAGRGFMLAVATGKSRRGLDRDLAATGLDRYMAASRTADETRSKPNPDMLLELMTRLDVGPERTLMVGDTEWDLEMARRAGVAAVAVSYGAHPAERLLQRLTAGLSRRYRGTAGVAGGSRIRHGLNRP
jgi:phosphoglycolate phosphatase